MSPGRVRTERKWKLFISEYGTASRAQTFAMLRFLLMGSSLQETSKSTRMLEIGRTTDILEIQLTKTSFFTFSFAADSAASSPVPAENNAVTQVCLPLGNTSKRSLSKQNAALDPSRAQKLIEAAASFRLRRKCEIFQRATHLRGREAALFEAIAAAMGFKNNKIPFLLVAQRASLVRARAAEGEALLFGLSGFLKAGHFDQGDSDARAYLRRLWEQWWAIRDHERRLILPDNAWMHAAVRPANHPHRRMGALVTAARSFAPISRSVERGMRTDFAATFASLEHAFWQRHASLAGDPLPKETSLVGSDRVLDLLINVFLPAQRFEVAWPQICSMQGPTPSRRIVKCSEWLSGVAQPAHFRTAMAQQGLLQLAEDFPHMSAQQVWQSFNDGWTPSEIV